MTTYTSSAIDTQIENIQKIDGGVLLQCVSLLQERQICASLYGEASSEDKKNIKAFIDYTDKQLKLYLGIM